MLEQTADTLEGNCGVHVIRIPSLYFFCVFLLNTDIKTCPFNVLNPVSVFL